ncbi:hypothetical protein EPO05_03740 [Patescibacteria group bacterium]|nr:MAG: hypothetical protein EPO05_03740 [Patescibacteria group bacterium]
MEENKPKEVGKIEFIDLDAEKAKNRVVFQVLLQHNIDKVISLLIALGYLTLATVNGAINPNYLVVFFPVILIWFGDDIADYTNRIIETRGVLGANPGIMSKSPGLLFKFCGWVLLLLPAAMALVGQNKW